MSVFETFYLLFKSDTSDLKKGTEEAEKTTEKLQKSLNAVDRNVLNVGQKFLGLATSFASLVASVWSAHEILMNFKEAEQYSTSLSKASQVLGVSSEEIDRWGEAVKRVGGTTDDFKNSLMGLAQHLGTTPEIALRTLPLLADAFQRMNRVQAFMYGRSLGITDPTILLLQKGKAGLDELLESLGKFGLTTEKDAEIARRFDTATLDLSQSFRNLYTRLNTELLPAFTWLLNKGIVPFVQYLQQHTSFVIGAFAGMTLAATALAISLGALASPIILIGGEILVLGVAFGEVFQKIHDVVEDNIEFFNSFVEAWKKGDNTVTDILKKWAKYLFALLSPLGAASEQLGELAGSTVSGLLSPEQDNSYDIRGMMQKSKNYLLAAETSPLNSQTNNSVLNNSAFNRNVHVNVDSIQVQTQATDAQGVSKAIGKSIESELWKVVNYFSDGRHN